MVKYIVNPCIDQRERNNLDIALSLMVQNVAIVKPKYHFHTIYDAVKATMM